MMWISRLARLIFFVGFSLAILAPAASSKVLALVGLLLMAIAICYYLGLLCLAVYKDRIRGSLVFHEISDEEKSKMD